MNATGRRLPRVAVLVVLLALSSAGPAVAREQACPGIPVSACGWSPAESDRICVAAAKALGFLEDIGVRTSRPMRIRPLRPAPGREDGKCLGEFDARTWQVRVLPYETAVVAMRGHPRGFGLPMTRRLWQSYVAHEVAHAAAEEGFADGVPRFTASEYLAAVVQIATMHEADRTLVLDRYRDTGAFADSREISGIYYLMDPPRFAVKSWRHYAGLGAEAPRFVARLLREGLPD